ncbi:MAG TPA: RNA polymerase sigma factor [Verrucomicrobiae bacterium]|nr:RNA polymerase sigma factor [Verrucomicrobiae bacterium]
MDDEQRAVILRCRQGDHSAFGSLVQMHQRMIHAVTYRMTGSMADAEDLAQETFIQAFQRLESFRGDAAFSSWLYRIAMNLCLNWHKRESRRNRLHEQWEIPENPAESRDVAEPWRVQNALMKLHPKQRAAIVLTIYEGKTHAEAGRILGCSETTVSWRVFSAKQKLKRWLAGKVRDE